MSTGESTATDAARRTAPARPRTPEIARRALPAWPFTMLFVLYPLIWANGLSVLALPLFGAICLFLMAVRGRIALPRTWMCWLAFLVWSLTSVVMVDSAGRLLGFAQRWSSLCGAMLIALYLHNAPERLTRRRATRGMTWMFMWLVAGGYLGMLKPYGRLSTLPLQMVPDNIRSNAYVLELLSPRFAEVQTPWGAPAPFVRPSAPFPYTNGWGDAFVLLLPVIATVFLTGSRRTRIIIVTLVVAAIPPALATLNRGLFVGVAVVIASVGARYMHRLRLGHLLRGLAALAVLAVGVEQSGVLHRIAQRTTLSSTTSDRLSIYEEAYRRTLESPWLGQGAPRPSASLDVSVGTQGQFWYVMFSHGFIGLGFFLAAVWGLTWITRRAPDLQSMLLHSVLVCISLLLMVYGQDGLHLLIAMSCGVLLLRPDAPARPPAEPLPAGSAPPTSAPSSNESPGSGPLGNGALANGALANGALANGAFSNGALGDGTLGNGSSGREGPTNESPGAPRLAATSTAERPDPAPPTPARPDPARSSAGAGAVGPAHRIPAARRPEPRELP